jgi:hypothetical protein
MAANMQQDFNYIYPIMSPPKSQISTTISNIILNNLNINYTIPRPLTPSQHHLHPPKPPLNHQKNV